MEPVRIGPFLPLLAETESTPTPAAKPEASVAATPVAPASSREGKILQPEVGDEVLVAFEHGDPRAPYVTGGLWNGEAPPTNASAAPGSTNESSFEQRSKLLEHQLKNLK